MKFIIEQSDVIEQGQLTYILEECSFNMNPIAYKVEIELILNKMSLVVSSNRVVQVSGFCGFKEWMKFNFEVPQYNKGILKVQHSLKHGFAYGINNEELPVYVNTKTGWVCIGDFKKSGEAVEFINDCVAVISADGKFIALWLKPKELPNL